MELTTCFDFNRRRAAELSGCFQSGSLGGGLSIPAAPSVVYKSAPTNQVFLRIRLAAVVLYETDSGPGLKLEMLKLEIWKEAGPVKYPHHLRIKVAV